MSAKTRTPYEDTAVPVGRSQEQIRRLLRDAGAEGVQFSEEWTTPPTFHIRFLWRLDGAGQDSASVVQGIRLRVSPLAEDAGGVWKSTEQRERQAWRGLAHYLEGTLKAATFGLIRFEDIFLSFVEMADGRTIGEAIIPRLAVERLALPPGDDR